MFNLGRILTGLASLAAVLVGAALGAPALMSWDHLRAPAEAKASALTGAPVRIDGRITLQLLPLPRLSLGHVVIEPREGVPISGDFSRARVHLKFWPLLSGEAVPAALAFSGADLLADRAALADGSPAAELGLPVTVRGGRVRFEADGTPVATDIGFDARAGREDATRLRMTGRFEDTPFSLRAVLRGEGEGALRSAALDFGKGQAVVSLVRAGPSADGGIDLQVKFNRGGKAAGFLGRIFPAFGRLVSPEQLASLAPLSAAVRAVPESDGVDLRGLEVTAGPLRLTGGGRLQPGATAGLNLELGARTLVLGQGESGFDPSGLLRLLGLIAEWGENVRGNLRLHADHVLAGGMVMRQSEIRLSFTSEGTRLDGFRMDLPGDLTFSGQGTAADAGQLAAVVRLDGARAAQLLSGLGADNQRIQQDDLPLKVEGELTLSGTRASLNDVHIEAGRNALRAEGALFFGNRPGADLRLYAGDLDLRRWGLSREDVVSDMSVTELWEGLEALASRADLTMRVELGSLRLTDTTLRDGIVDLALDEDQVILRRLSVEEDGGRSLEARLRAPLGSASAGSGLKSHEPGGDVAGWTARAEAAIEVRPAQEDSYGLAWRAGLWDGVLSIETDSPMRSRLSGKLAEADSGFRWLDFQGRIGRAAVNGELTFRPDERPLLEGKVHIRKAAIRLAGGEDDNLWPGWELSNYWPRGIDIHLDWSADDLTVAGAQLTAAEGMVSVEREAARIVLVSGNLLGGTASGSASLSAGPEGTMLWESQGVVQHADLAAILGGGWQGHGMLRQSTSGAGESIAAIISGLRGTVGFGFEDGQIGGLDTPKLSSALAGLDSTTEIQAVINRAFGAGTTPFRRLEGEARIGNGEIVLSGISAQTATGPIMLSGVVSLPARLIAAQADISLGDQVGVPLSVQFIGRMEAPERILDTERLEKRLTQ